VVKNNFYRNYLGGMSQGYDDDGGLTNRWNLTYPQGGNFWDNWTAPDDCDGASQSNCGGNPDGFVDSPYYIAGSGLSRDYYPLTTRNPSVPQFGGALLVLLALAASGTAFAALRRTPGRR
jgi:hypothetical protein